MPSLNLPKTQLLDETPSDSRLNSERRQKDVGRNTEVELPNSGSAVSFNNIPKSSSEMDIFLLEDQSPGKSSKPRVYDISVSPLIEEEKMHRRKISQSSVEKSQKDLHSIAEIESEFTETTNNDMSVISGVISDMGANQALKSSVFSSNMLRTKSINLAPNPIANKSNIQKPRRSNDRLTNFVNEFAYSLGLDPKMFV